MPVYTSPDRIPAPADTGEPPAASQLQDLAAVVQSLVVSLRGVDAANLSRLTSLIADARVLRAGVVAGSSGTTTVVTGQLGIDGCVVNVPAGVGCVVTVTYDVSTTVYNGACTFEGRLRRIVSGTANDVPGQATYTAGVNGASASVSRSWEFGPAASPYTIQANVRKNNTNANYVVNNTNTVLSYTFLRTGVL